MIRTEQGYAQIFKIYGKSETEVKEKLQDLLKCGGALYHCEPDRYAGWKDCEKV